jgi:hypothetical protein
MTDIETTLRRGLAAFGEETAEAAVPPSLSLIARLADAAEPQVRARRWPKVAVATVAGLAVTGGVASAVGVLPEPVESTLREFRSWGFDANQGAERMATVTDGDLTYEVWRAPLDGGGQCVYDRVIGPDGDIDRGGGSHCHGAVNGHAAPRRSPDGFGELHFPSTVFDNSGGADPVATPLHSVSSGQLPVGATEAVFEFEDGTTLEVAAQHEGYFITTFPGIDDGLRIVEIRALDGGGNVVVRDEVGESPDIEAEPEAEPEPG